jgi:hypothetical protein
MRALAVRACPIAETALRSANTMKPHRLIREDRSSENPHCSFDYDAAGTVIGSKENASVAFAS